MSPLFSTLPFSASRRAFAAGGASLFLAAAAAPVFARTVDDFIGDIWRRAQASGVPRSVFDAAMGGFRPLDNVLELTRKQPEFTSTAADYVNKRVTDRQAANGRQKRGEWAETLAAVNARYGVQPEAVVAIWGIETNYGGYMGSISTVHALATLTWGGYRADYFRGELITALQILAAGHVTADRMVGSWAGAMGHPQFMPSSFTRFAVDFRGNGRKDIWGSVPDALASAANYLKSHKWRPGETWGYEVKLPAGFDYGQVWSRTETTVANWRAKGVTRASGAPFPRDGDVARLFMPMGGNGPVFLLLPNFDVIKRYNNSDSYALAVGHLADRTLGAGGFVAPWPDDTALNRAGREEVQTLLARKGYQIGGVDGVIGSRTRGAVMQWQARQGLLPDGHVGGRLLAALRG